MMCEEISVLITDDNIQFGNLLCEYMDRYEDIRTLGIARDGFQAIELIQRLLPDVVILDIVMPNLDGIGVLERVSTMQLKKRPIFIALSAIGQDVFIQHVILLGAEYYIMKPFDIDVLVTRIRQIYRERNAHPILSGNRGRLRNEQQTNSFSESVWSMEMEVTAMLRNTGIPPHLTGYQYLREAIVRTVLNGSQAHNSITKVLYPDIARKFRTTPRKVERAIRSAIESVWGRADCSSRTLLPGIKIQNGRSKPTNSELIAVIAEKVMLTAGERHKQVYK